MRFVIKLAFSVVLTVEIAFVPLLADNSVLEFLFECKCGCSSGM